MPTIAEESYVRLTTFTRDGRRKESPIWIAELADGRLGFTTSPASWKAKRVRNTPRVELTACDRTGKATLGAPTVTGTGAMADDAEIDRVKEAIRAKYGFQFKLIEMLATITKLFRGGPPAASGAIIVTLDEESASG